MGKKLRISALVIVAIIAIALLTVASWIFIPTRYIRPREGAIFGDLELKSHPPFSNTTPTVMVFTISVCGERNYYLTKNGTCVSSLPEGLEEGDEVYSTGLAYVKTDLEDETYWMLEYFTIEILRFEPLYRCSITPPPRYEFFVLIVLTIAIGVCIGYVGSKIMTKDESQVAS